MTTKKQQMDGMGVVQPNVNAALPSDQYNTNDKNMSRLKRKIRDDYRKILEHKGRDCIIKTTAQESRQRSREGR